MRGYLLLATACLVAGLLLAGNLQNPTEERAHSPPRAPAAPEAVMATAHEHRQLRLVTLNAWGLWLVARHRSDRMAALAAWLRSPECPDVVLLQEVWLEADAALLRQAGAEGRLAHSFHWQSGAIGSGLLVFSRHPIEEVGFHPYSARGDPAAVLNGDFYAGKGVGWAALQTPCGRLSVFNTHLSANYGQEWAWQVGARALASNCRLPRDSLAGVRLSQMLELAAFVRSRGAGSGAGVVLAGDLNSAPDTLEYAVLQALLPELRDAWAEACPLLLGATANALESSFTTAGAGHRPIRIDYILTTLRPLAAELALTDTGLGYSYSDHLGVAATLGFGSGDAKDGSSGSMCSSRGSDGTDGPVACKRQTAQPNGQQSAAAEHQQQLAAQPSAAELMQRHPAPFQEAAAQLESAVAAMRRGRRRFLALSAGLWAAGFGCLGALVVQRSRSSGHYLPLLGGVGVALGWAGVIFIGGFVGRGVELRALQQAAWQLRLAVGGRVPTAVA